VQAPPPRYSPLVPPGGACLASTAEQKTPPRTGGHRAAQSRSFHHLSPQRAGETTHPTTHHPETNPRPTAFSTRMQLRPCIRVTRVTRPPRIRGPFLSAPPSRNKPPSRSVASLDAAPQSPASREPILGPHGAHHRGPFLEPYDANHFPTSRPPAAEHAIMGPQLKTASTKGRGTAQAHGGPSDPVSSG
jgi:hypothetical protein